MIIEGLLTAMMTMGQPAVQTRARVRYYKRIQARKKALLPQQTETNNGPKVVRSLTCFTPMCSTFEELWQDRILQWRVMK